MKVYIVNENYPYEGNVIRGVFSNEVMAQEKIKELEKNDTTDGYNKFSVIEREVDT